MPGRIVYLYKRWQPLYDQMRDECPNIEFIKGIPSDLDNDSFFDIEVTNLILIDDLMHRQNEMIADLFTEGSHHRNLSVINVTQTSFLPVNMQSLKDAIHSTWLFLSHRWDKIKYEL